ncbi:1-(5-phosphoribosyl)-5-amino-4-imidazole-carboxylate carboxylase [Vulcanibacillus modesticaldus]|uniref:1-(5-phosphoribosyl)-5-amino-4-imidazole-carboxylate carboxylase n=1 Tax=Vulcanibacillus modesticaldus TaxID=337097 RepID=A0A1D2YUK6_9BACI|nr:nickel pincer cofactor biosynthesis protein LarB [Vulcanibacillus modesticaldus]OEF99379.1 1-(5-phosphoribosyl)-5-amino-4-imidazole-carboxylate carboxylase [Vulcanibacillus modesticaldus]
MGTTDHLSIILEGVQNGSLTIKEAKKKLKTYEDLGFANLDIHRAKRTGFPEVIYGEGKTTEQVVKIFESLSKKNSTVLATRVTEEMGYQVLKRLPKVHYNKTARTLLWKKNPEPIHTGYIAVVCAGTSDLPVAEEAVTTVQAMGSIAELICDVGVAGLHRLIDKINLIKNANVIIVVAGMEGALPSVIAGLVDKPVIAVPTSVGYGANFKGLSALLGMLNSCANGISVVNIDNGFGAGYQAGLINKLMNPTVKEKNKL